MKAAKSASNRASHTATSEKDAATVWHQLESNDVLQKLKLDFKPGLFADEVKRRRAEFGLNQMTARRGTPAWVKFLQQFNQALVYILLAATVVSALLGEWVDAAVIPFESEHMFMATLHRAADDQVIYRKGSIERLLERYDKVLDAAGQESPLDADAVNRAVDEMTAQGLRVLAFARRRAPSSLAKLTHNDVAGGLTLLGLQGMIDPPRAEAIRAVGQCQSAGIEVKMITGDHKGTAVAIGQQLGLRGGKGSEGQPVAITGRELEGIPDDQLPATAERAAVFARVAPEQKLRLVKALQSRGHIVAMTGDGVNDAPALKQADIGVAMGITGTDVSKGAADMILTDDNFASIEAAVEEGRNVFDNLTKFITWTMPTNGGEGLLILTAIVMGTALPVLPVQLLWINMSTALLLGLMLVFEPKEAGIMSRPPREPAQPILAAQLLFTYAPFMNKLFHSAPISGLAWLKIIGVGLVVFVAVELKKWLDARRRKDRSGDAAG